ncbi:unnamed protein product [Lathyrus oleraceus]
MNAPLPYSTPPPFRINTQTFFSLFLFSLSLSSSLIPNLNFLPSRIKAGFINHSNNFRQILNLTRAERVHISTVSCMRIFIVKIVCSVDYTCNINNWCKLEIYSGKGSI